MAAFSDIKDLQRKLLELQQELPSSGDLQIELQRLQNQLNELQNQPIPVLASGMVVKPMPMPVQLEGQELAVVETFTRLVRALSNIVPIDHLFATAASLTLATRTSET